MRYGSWDTEWDRQNFFVILGLFLPVWSFWTIVCPFPTLTIRKIKTLKNWKKTLGHIIILHICTINYNHMMYDIWDIECSGQSVLSFWIGFCPFTPQATQKIKILEKWKKRLGDIILHVCAINDNHMVYGSWDMEHYGHNFLSFWTILCSVTLLLP